MVAGEAERAFFGGIVERTDSKTPGARRKEWCHAQGEVEVKFEGRGMRVRERGGLGSPKACNERGRRNGYGAMNNGPDVEKATLRASGKSSLPAFPAIPPRLAAFTSCPAFVLYNPV